MPDRFDGQKDRAVLWGTGIIGSSRLVKELLEKKYRLVCYCDSDQRKCGSCLNGLDVVWSEDLARNPLSFDTIIIAVKNKRAIQEIRGFIQEKISRSLPVLTYEEISLDLENDYIREMKKESRWNVDYSSQCRIWVEHLMDEVKFWSNSVAKESGSFHSDYTGRIRNQRFLPETFASDPASAVMRELEQRLETMTDPRVYDIGCGLAPLRGDVLSNGRRIQLTRVDALAHFYNRINREYANGKADFTCRFGIFEFLSAYFPSGTGDAIIIRNALDHSIDPYQSILECLKLLKTGGAIYMTHYRSYSSDPSQGWRNEKGKERRENLQKVRQMGFRR